MRRIATLFLLAALVAACGTRGDILGSQRNAPDAGIFGWKKVDLRPDLELTQPFILTATPGTELLEPALVRMDGRWVCYFEWLVLGVGDAPIRSAIHVIESDDALHWRLVDRGISVLDPTEPWEGDFVGAPSIVRVGSRWRMYYAGGDGTGIGAAESDDGMVWEKLPGPVLVPDQVWEKGKVHAPSALVLDGRVHIWYSAGEETGNAVARRAGRAIGYAASDDGLDFVKSPEGPNPVLRPSDAWEGCGENADGPCVVSSPSVVVHESTQRRVLQMFYTGGEPGEIGRGDASVGAAASEDGLTWEKADEYVNPVVQELFPLQFSGLEEILTTDESAPSVVHRGGRSFMVFTQLDPTNWLAYGLKGLAVATNPPLE